MTVDYVLFYPANSAEKCVSCLNNRLSVSDIEELIKGTDYEDNSDLKKKHWVKKCEFQSPEGNFCRNHNKTGNKKDKSFHAQFSEELHEKYKNKYWYNFVYYKILSDPGTVTIWEDKKEIEFTPNKSFLCRASEETLPIENTESPPHHEPSMGNEAKLTVPRRTENININVSGNDKINSNNLPPSFLNIIDGFFKNNEKPILLSTILTAVLTALICIYNSFHYKALGFGHLPPISAEIAGNNFLTTITSALAAILISLFTIQRNLSRNKEEQKANKEGIEKNKSELEGIQIKNKKVLEEAQENLKQINSYPSEYQENQNKQKNEISKIKDIESQLQKYLDTLHKIYTNAQNSTDSKLEGVNPSNINENIEELIATLRNESNYNIRPKYKRIDKFNKTENEDSQTDKHTNRIKQLDSAIRLLQELVEEKKGKLYTADIKSTNNNPTSPGESNYFTNFVSWMKDRQRSVYERKLEKIQKLIDDLRIKMIENRDLRLKALGLIKRQEELLPLYEAYETANKSFNQTENEIGEKEREISRQKNVIGRIDQLLWRSDSSNIDVRRFVVALLTKYPISIFLIAGISVSPTFTRLAPNIISSNYCGTFADRILGRIILPRCVTVYWKDGDHHKITTDVYKVGEHGGSHLFKYTGTERSQTLQIPSEKILYINTSPNAQSNYRSLIMSFFSNNTGRPPRTEILTPDLGFEHFDLTYKLDGNRIVFPSNNAAILVPAFSNTAKGEALNQTKFEPLFKYQKNSRDRYIYNGQKNLAPTIDTVLEAYLAGFFALGMDESTDSSNVSPADILDTITNGLARCRKTDGSPIKIDVQGYADDVSFADLRNSDELNHALAEGRRAAILNHLGMRYVKIDTTNTEDNAIYHVYGSPNSKRASKESKEVFKLVLSPEHDGQFKAPPNHQNSCFDRNESSDNLLRYPNLPNCFPNEDEPHKGEGLIGFDAFMLSGEHIRFEGSSTNRWGYSSMNEARKVNFSSLADQEPVSARDSQANIKFPILGRSAAIIVDMDTIDTNKCLSSFQTE